MSSKKQDDVFKKYQQMMGNKVEADDSDISESEESQTAVGPGKKNFAAEMLAKRGLGAAARAPPKKPEP
jgi:hypothetical protein